MSHLKGNTEIYYVTVHLNLPDFPLQYLVRSSVSMNPSPGIYGGRQTLLWFIITINLYYHTLCVYWCFTHNHEKPKDWPRYVPLGYVFTALHFSILPSSLKCNIRVLVLECLLPLSRKQVACRQARPTNIFLNKGTPAYSYLPLSIEREFMPLMEMRCFPLSNDLQGLNVESN